MKIQLLICSETGDSLDQLQNVPCFATVKGIQYSLACGIDHSVDVVWQLCFSRAMIR